MTSPSPASRDDVRHIIREAQSISSYVDEEAEEALLTAREQRLDGDETIRLQSRVISLVSRRDRGHATSDRGPTPRAGARPGWSERLAAGLRRGTEFFRIPIPGAAIVLLAVLLAPLAGYVLSSLNNANSGSSVVALSRENHSFDNLFGTFPAPSKESAGSVQQGAATIQDTSLTVAGDLGRQSRLYYIRSHKATAAGSGSSSAVIQTDTLTIKVTAHETTGVQASRVESLALRNGGTVASKTRSGSGSDVTVTVTIPASRFYAVLQIIYPLGRVEYENLTSQDVTLQEVNLGARLTNLKTQRVVLLALFNKTSNVGATIHVQQVLSSVQSQIDQIQAQMRYLNSRTSMASISVTFVTHSVGTVRPVHHSNGPLARAVTDAGTAATNVFTGLIVLIGYAIPVGLLGAIVFLLYGVVRGRPAWSRSKA